MEFKRYIIKSLSSYLIFTSLFQCSSKNDNNYDDINQLLRDTNDIARRIDRINREKADRLIEEINEKIDKYLFLQERKFAPICEDGMTKYEREYYEENYKKILNDGLQKISNAKNNNELGDIYRKYKDEICKLIDNARTYELCLSDVHMKTYTDTQLHAAFKKRLDEIQLKFSIIAITAVLTSAAVGIKVYDHYKNEYPES